MRMLEQFKPQEPVESMLAVQMIGTHNAAMDCLRRAALPEQFGEVRDQELKHACKLLGIYARQIEALGKHRGKGQQKVTVEHIHVEPGAQAIVAHVDANGRETRSWRGPPPAFHGNGSDDSEHRADPSIPSAPPVRRRFRQ